MHYNLNFKPDRYGNKQELVGVSALLSGVSIFVYFLIINIRKIDPKQSKMPASFTFQRIAMLLVVFIAAINFVILISAAGKPHLMEKVLFPMIGIFFAMIGNYMYNIKPNYFAGIRLPWTLSDDDNWRRTHHLASKLWFWGGISAALICLIFPSTVSTIIFFTILLTVVIIPMVYSYKIFKESKPL